MPFCAYCGTEVALGLRSCPECGHPQSASGPVMPAAVTEGLPPGFDFGTYVGPKTTDGFATASLVMGVAGLVICPVIGSFMALILGMMARRRIDKDPSKAGKGLATGGIVTGALGIVIVPIIIAALIPVFIGARDEVQDVVAQANLAAGFQSAVGIANQARSYRAVDDQSLAAAGTGLSWVNNGESGGPNIVSYMVVDETEIRMALRSDSGRCLAMRDDVGGLGVGYASHDEGTQCNAGAFRPEEFAGSSSVTET